MEIKKTKRNFKSFKNPKTIITLKEILSPKTIPSYFMIMSSQANLLGAWQILKHTKKNTNISPYSIYILCFKLEYNYTYYAVGHLNKKIKGDTLKSIFKKITNYLVIE